MIVSIPFSLRLLNGLPDDSPEFFGFAPPYIAQIDFVMEPVHSEILRIAPGFGAFFHGGHSGGLIVIGADMHALDAQPLLPGEKLHLGEVPLLFLSSFPDGPVENIMGHKLRQANERDPLKIPLAGIVYPVCALPAATALPEAAPT